MNLKQPVYEALMVEVQPKELNFPIKAVKVALYGFSEETDRYMQIEEALNDRYASHAPAEVTLMRREQVKKLRRKIKERSLRRPDGSPNGVLILPLEAAWPSQSGDDPKTLI